MKKINLKVKKIKGDNILLVNGSFKLLFSKRSDVVKGTKFKEGDNYLMTLKKA